MFGRKMQKNYACRKDYSYAYFIFEKRESCKHTGKFTDVGGNPMQAPGFPVFLLFIQSYGTGSVDKFHVRLQFQKTTVILMSFSKSRGAASTRESSRMLALIARSTRCACRVTRGCQSTINLINPAGTKNNPKVHGSTSHTRSSRGRRNSCCIATQQPA